MKRFLLILAVLALVVIAALGIFLATFDIDRYRPRLISEIERAIGKPVTLQRVSLGWQGGLAVQLRGLAILEGAPDSGQEPLAQVETATALVSIGPLLRKEVRIESVVLTRPRIHVSRNAQGHLNVTGLAAVGAPAAAASQTAASGAPVTLEIASLSIEEGSVHWTDAMTQPPTDVWVKPVDVRVTNIVPGHPMQIELRAAVAGPTQNLELSGRFTPPSPGVEGSVEQLTGSLDALPLESILPPPPPGAGHVNGKLSLTFQGGTNTLEPSRVRQALSGTGTLKLADGVIADFNILQEVFSRFSMIPGLVSLLESRLPPEALEKFRAQDTALQPVNLSMAVQDGALRFQDLRVRADIGGLTGSGQVSLDGHVDFPHLLLQVDPALSAAIIRSVNELQALTNPAGELELPVMVQGPLTQLSLVPDVRYVASKVIVSRAVDFIGELLRKGEEPPPAEGADPASASPDAPFQPPADPLADILHRALRKYAPSGAPAQ